MIELIIALVIVAVVGVPGVHLHSKWKKEMNQEK